MSAAGQRPQGCRRRKKCRSNVSIRKRTTRNAWSLYVEDDDATAYMFQKALEYNRNNVRLFRVDDGEKAVAFLFHEGIFHEAAGAGSRRPRPEPPQAERIRGASRACATRMS